MGTVRTDELCKNAVRIALTDGISQKQTADDLWVGRVIPPESKGLRK